ncbi:MAG: class I tRNA ligase family protein, partial [Bacteroidota bacterium]|nr:class I tRNA ligase family protein [Bacteroidota bacterium]
WNYNGFERETTTMPGWAGSSWYFLRYMDPHNEKEFVSRKAEEYWKNVDLYIGGSEHATGHLLYARFWQKFFFDRGWVSMDEPFQKLINQGMIGGTSAYLITTELTNASLYDEESLNLQELPFNWFFVSSNEFEKDPEKQGWLGNQIENRNDWPIQIREYLEKHEREQNAIESKEGSFTLRLRKFGPIPIEYINEGDNTLDVESFKKDPKYRDLKADFIFSHGGLKVLRENEKMSKSKFNVVTPDAVIEEHGADALRMYEMFLGPIEQSKPWNTQGLSGVTGFLRKFWRLSHREGDFIVSDEVPNEKELKALHTCIKKVNEDMKNFSFNTSVSAFMICTNELTDLKCNKRSIIEPLVILLSPFAPHMAEELWEKLGHLDSVTRQPYPTHEEKHLVESTKNYPVSFNGKVRFQIALPADMGKEDVEASVMADERTAKYLDGKQIRKVIVVPGRIVNIVIG